LRFFEIPNAREGQVGVHVNRSSPYQGDCRVSRAIVIGEIVTNVSLGFLAAIKHLTCLRPNQSDKHQ
jgi:hypothetical protein